MGKQQQQQQYSNANALVRLCAIMAFQGGKTSFQNQYQTATGGQYPTTPGQTSNCVINVYLVMATSERR